MRFLKRNTKTICDMKRILILAIIGLFAAGCGKTDTLSGSQWECVATKDGEKTYLLHFLDAANVELSRLFNGEKVAEASGVYTYDGSTIIFSRVHLKHEYDTSHDGYQSTARTEFDLVDAILDEGKKTMTATIHYTLGNQKYYQYVFTRK